MTLYRCQVITAEGRTGWKSIDAISPGQAAARIVADGLTPIDIRTGKVGLVERLNQPLRIGGGLGIAEQALLLTQLAMLIRSGLPVDRSLDLLRDQAPKARQRQALAQILGDIRGGSPLGRALERQSIFPAYVIGIVQAAEKTGRLGEALTSVAARMTAASATRRQLITALTYPAAVLAATLMALILVLTIVVPQFEPVFAGQEAKLPALTRAVLAISALVRDYGLGLLCGAVGLVALGFYLVRSPAFTAFLQRYRASLPGLRLRDQYLAAQFTGLLSTLLGNGVSVVRALPLTASAIGSRRWRGHIETVEARVREGSAFSRALAREAFVPATVVRLLEVGEKTGSLAETCLRANEIIADATKARIDRIVSLANPIAIVTLGGIVAMLVAGVMLGIFAIGDFAG